MTIPTKSQNLAQISTNFTTSANVFRCLCIDFFQFFYLQILVWSVSKTAARRLFRHPRRQFSRDRREMVGARKPNVGFATIVASGAVWIAGSRRFKMTTDWDDKISVAWDSLWSVLNEPLRISLGIVTENGAGSDGVSKVLAKPLVLLSNCIDCSGDGIGDVFANPL